ncbi:maleylpyruvate isomerase N-terminal domain-containing protein [Nocardia beijingensis]
MPEIPEPVVRAFTEESARWEEALAALTGSEFSRPTPCPPWTVAELVAHVTSAVARVPAGLAVAPPPHADLDAAGYYHPGIFDAAANTERVAAAQRDAAAHPDPVTLVAAFQQQRRLALHAVAGHPLDRLVVTRWGDGMILREFLLTRVVELVLHGLDLTAALDTPAWTTPTAATLVAEFLGVTEAADRLGWDSPTALAKGSGRTPLTHGEHTELTRTGTHWRRFG